WYRPLLHTENRFASQSMEHEEQALFRHLRHSRNALSVLHGFDERRRRIDVPVINVVVRELEVPLPFSSRCLKREQRRGVEVQSWPAVAKILVRCIAERYEDEVIDGIH